MKPGYKTSEFWMASIGQVVGALVASGAFDCPVGTECNGTVIVIGRLLGLVTMILTNLGYVVPRSMAKAKEASAVAGLAALPVNPPKP